MAYLTGLALRTMLTLAALLVACAPVALWGTRKASTVSEPTTLGGLIIGLLAIMGVALPIVGVLLARADWLAAARLSRVAPADPTQIRLGRPRSWARPLAYAALQLTAGGAVVMASAVTAAAVVVAAVSPLLVAAGDTATIGPLVVRTQLSAWSAVAVGALLVVAAVVTGPWVASLHARLVFALLASPEHRLQHALTMTAQSRRRVVAAFDLERRRIERDLHDGVQPQLMSISMTLGLALAAIPDGTPGRSDVDRAQRQAQAAVQDLRRFVRAIHPHVLTDHGLAAAVAELADGLTVRTSVTDRLTERPPVAVENSLYFCIAELLTNAVKHSGADSVEVVLSRAAPPGTRVTVHDRGLGGATVGQDGGLAGIADRVAALGGTLTISSPPAGPTHVEIYVPDLFDLTDPTSDGSGARGPNQSDIADTLRERP